MPATAAFLVDPGADAEVGARVLRPEVGKVMLSEIASAGPGVAVATVVWPHPDLVRSRERIIATPALK